jgi:dipeptidase D
MEKPQNYPVQPEHIWEQFFQITQIPRPSKHEDKMVAYLEKLARENDLEYKTDGAKNVVIYVPGTNGRENDDPVIIQNHIDMVTDATPDRKINFKTDPITTFVENGWLKADRTTLGADNGIGCAAALATIFEKDITHPPLELLFTTDEETGLNGALNLDTGMLQGRKMLNLDTEEWGSVYIGCAGGIDYELTRDVDFHPVMGKGLKITLGKLVGGHSGVDIHEQRGNAIKLLMEAVGELTTDYRLVEIRAGKAHNIIPRDAYVIVALDDDAIEGTQKEFLTIAERWRSFLPEQDSKFEVEFDVIDLDGKKALDRDDTNRIVSLLGMFPHGVHSYDLASKREIVSMSNNLAKVLMMNGKFYIQTSLRFFDREEVRSLEHQLKMLGKTFDLKVTSNSEYPSWKPVWENKILETVQMKYKEIFGQEVNVTAIHAGLECGILRDKIGPIDVVSFGPTIMGAHSPDERIEIETVTKFWQLFKGVLEVI